MTIIRGFNRQVIWSASWPNAGSAESAQHLIDQGAVFTKAGPNINFAPISRWTDATLMSLTPRTMADEMYDAIPRLADVIVELYFRATPVDVISEMYSVRFRMEYDSSASCVCVAGNNNDPHYVPLFTVIAAQAMDKIEKLEYRNRQKKRRVDDFFDVALARGKQPPIRVNIKEDYMRVNQELLIQTVLESYERKFEHEAESDVPDLYHKVKQQATPWANNTDTQMYRWTDDYIDFDLNTPLEVKHAIVSLTALMVDLFYRKTPREQRNFAYGQEFHITSSSSKPVVMTREYTHSAYSCLMCACIRRATEVTSNSGRKPAVPSDVNIEVHDREALLAGLQEPSESHPHTINRFRSNYGLNLPANSPDHPGLVWESDRVELVRLVDLFESDPQNHVFDEAGAQSVAWAAPVGHAIVRTNATYGAPSSPPKEADRDIERRLFEDLCKEASDVVYKRFIESHGDVKHAKHLFDRVMHNVRLLPTDASLFLKGSRGYQLYGSADEDAIVDSFLASPLVQRIHSQQPLFDPQAESDNMSDIKAMLLSAADNANLTLNEAKQIASNILNGAS
jgi:hypothetical protein